MADYVCPDWDYCGTPQLIETIMAKQYSTKQADELQRLYEASIESHLPPGTFEECESLDVKLQYTTRETFCGMSFCSFRSNIWDAVTDYVKNTKPERKKDIFIWEFEEWSAPEAPKHLQYLNQRYAGALMIPYNQLEDDEKELMQSIQSNFLANQFVFGSLGFSGLLCLVCKIMLRNPSHSEVTWHFRTQKHIWFFKKLDIGFHKRIFDDWNLIVLDYLPNPNPLLQKVKVSSAKERKMC